MIGVCVATQRSRRSRGSPCGRAEDEVCDCELDQQQPERAQRGGRERGPGEERGCEEEAEVERRRRRLRVLAAPAQEALGGQHEQGGHPRVAAAAAPGRAAASAVASAAAAAAARRAACAAAAAAAARGGGRLRRPAAVAGVVGERPILHALVKPVAGSGGDDASVGGDDALVGGRGASAHDRALVSALLRQRRGRASCLSARCRWRAHVCRSRGGGGRRLQPRSARRGGRSNMRHNHRQRRPRKDAGSNVQRALREAAARVVRRVGECDAAIEAHHHLRNEWDGATRSHVVTTGDPAAPNARWRLAGCLECTQLFRVLNTTSLLVGAAEASGSLALSRHAPPPAPPAGPRTRDGALLSTKQPHRICDTTPLAAAAARRPLRFPRSVPGQPPSASSMTLSRAMRMKSPFWACRK